VDAVDWVTLPNTLGMVMHADGGLVGSKPYAASGRYIQRMSDYCKDCRYDPAKRAGLNACPFTTFYWDFLIRNRQRFRGNRRMTMILKNLDRISEKDCRAIRVHAQGLREQFGVGVRS
jgi:deoxyribodipyrimidine photolyase-related protein